MTTRLVLNGSLRKARPLKTGQTTSQGSGTGVDDGALQKGLAKSYTVKTTGQYAGAVNIVLNSKTDAHSNNCVLDNNTGLMWSRYVPASVGPSSDGKLPWTTNGNGEGIFEYAAAANAAALAGFTDWRIANFFELMTLLDLEPPTAAPDGTAFPTWPTASTVHQSSTAPADTTLVHAFSFTTGTPTPGTKTTSRYCALVRG